MGPGTELSKLLSRLGVRHDSGCKCLKHARKMDEMGAGWCRANIPTIVTWLKEEARRRSRLWAAVPDAVTRRVVLMAIKASERKDRLGPV